MAKDFKKFLKELEETKIKETPKEENSFSNFLKENNIISEKEPEDINLDLDEFVDLDPRISKLIDEHFWDLIDNIPQPKSIQGVPGLDGTPIELIKDNEEIKWKYVGTNEAETLINLNEVRGENGKDGLNGKDGKDGKDGQNGRDGKDGKDGKQGPKGEKGERGEQGIPGKDGVDGKDGKDGQNGKDGKDGLNGKDGKDGKQGPKGERGIQGEKGEKGDKGEKGEKGDRGEIGPIGLPGIQGKQGEKGDKGEQGIVGPRGEKGEKGDRGERGEPGKPGPKGEKGPRGEKGEQGIPGKDGRELQVRQNGDWIEYKYEDEDKWKTLFSIFNYNDKQVVTFAGPAGERGKDGRQGEDGEKVELRKNESKVQYKYESDTEWIDLFTIPTGEGGGEINLDTPTTVNGILTGDGSTINYIQDNSFNWNEAYSWGAISAYPSGFPNRSDSSISLSDRTFTISTPTSFDIYINGKKYTKTTEQITIPNTAGIHFIYYDSLGVLTTATTPWDLLSTVQVATVYWNGTKGVLQEERHGTIMDPATHDVLHNTVGTRYAYGLGGSFTNTTFTVSSGAIYDEDIKHTINSQTLCRVFYKDGTSSFTFTDPQASYYYKPATDIHYNNGNVSTPIPSSQFVAYWIFATNIIDYPIISIMGQRIDNTLNNARTNNTYESLNLADLPFAEMKLLYRVILRDDATPYEEFLDLRNISNLPAGQYIPTDHSSLTGLSNPSHPAAAIYTDTTNFNNFLSVEDDTVQKALEKINNIEDSSVAYSKKIDFVGDYIYKGEAIPGALTSSASWRISRTYIDPADGDITITWADGVGTFNKVWDNHLTLNYS